MKYRIIYDECSARQEHRPTMLYDVEEDVHILDKDGSDITEDTFLSDVANICGFDYDEVLEMTNGETALDKAIDLIGWFYDPEDGPEFIYISIDGKPLGTNDDERFEGVDFENCSEEDIKNILKKDAYDPDQDDDAYYEDDSYEEYNDDEED